MPIPLPRDAVNAADAIFCIKHQIHECRVRALAGDPSAYPEAYALVANLNPLWHPAADEVADAHALIGPSDREEHSY